MTNIVICGANGKMGKNINACIEARDDCQTVGGVDIYTKQYADFPIVETPAQLPVKPDVIIDFSNPALLDSLLDYCLSNLLVQLAKKAASVLGDQFDIEIVEKHHNQKIDAPSGTAIMLANAINETLDNSKHYVYDRHSRRQKREKSEIGMHAIRGGTIVGEHDVIFAGNDEVITLSHSAASKTVFAAGAVNAAVFIKDKPAGLYDMSQLV